MHTSKSLRRAVQLKANEVAVSCGARLIRWRELLDRTQRIAAGLHARGMRRRERIVMLGENGLPFYELYLVAPWAGLIMASLNTRWSRAEMIDALNDCGATALVVDGGHVCHVESIREAVPSLKLVIAADDEARCQGDCSWEDLACHDDILQEQPMRDDETAYLFYTGGTTGRAKGVMLTSANLIAAGLSTHFTSGVTATSVFAISVPLFHMSGGGLVNAQLTAAATAHLLPKFDPVTAMTAVEQQRTTHVVWIATMLAMILDHPDFGRFDLSSLERVIYGSAPMPEALLRRAMVKLPGAAFTQYYGMTETSGTGTTLEPESHDPDGVRAHRLRSAGRVVAGAELKIVRPNGSSASLREAGEIHLRGPIVSPGYWNQPQRTAEAIRDGWIHTGDIGWIDEEGYVYVVDRLKDMIISGGENVYSTEVENALYAHPSVFECGVIGLPDEKWGEIVCAVIYLKGGRHVTTGELIHHCRLILGGYKVPKEVIITAHPLPKSSAGKILKSALREFVQDRTAVASELDQGGGST